MFGEKDSTPSLTTADNQLKLLPQVSNVLAGYGFFYQFFYVNVWQDRKRCHEVYFTTFNFKGYVRKFDGPLRPDKLPGHLREREQGEDQVQPAGEDVAALRPAAREEERGLEN